MKAPAKTNNKQREAPTPAVLQPQSREFISFEEAGGVIPEHLRGDTGAGLENLEREDLAIPIIKLMQGLSSEVDEHDGLRPGNWFHTGTEHIFKEPFLVVPVYVDRRFILWRPREDGGGILARADDGKHWIPANKDFPVKTDAEYGGKQVVWRTADTVAESGLAVWGTMDPTNPNSPPIATKIVSYVVCFWQYPNMLPALLSFQRSSLTIANNFASNIKSKGVDLEHLIYQFGSKKVTNNNGQEYYAPRYTARGYVPKHLQAEFDAMAKTFQKIGLRPKDIDQTQTNGDAIMDDERPEKPSRRGEDRPNY